MVLRIDELNIVRSMPYEEYFGSMVLSDGQKRHRMDFADDFELFMLAALNTVDIMREYGDINWDYVRQYIVDGYNRILQERGAIDNRTSEIVNAFADDFIRSTKAIGTGETLLALWLLSEDRARYNAENEANRILNYTEHKDAVNSGYTTKTWHTERDNRVRDTHVPMDGVSIGIFDYFKVGASYMLYPKYYDPVLVDPKEVVNCRCAVSYS